MLSNRHLSSSDPLRRKYASVSKDGGSLRTWDHEKKVQHIEEVSKGLVVPDSYKCSVRNSPCCIWFSFTTNRRQTWQFSQYLNVSLAAGFYWITLTPPIYAAFMCARKSPIIMQRYSRNNNDIRLWRLWVLNNNLSRIKDTTCTFIQATPHDNFETFFCNFFFFLPRLIIFVFRKHLLICINWNVWTLLTL